MPTSESLLQSEDHASHSASVLWNTPVGVTRDSVGQTMNLARLLKLAFPLALLTLNLGAAVVAFYTGDRRRSVYWLCSAICVACVAEL